MFSLFDRRLFKYFINKKNGLKEGKKRRTSFTLQIEFTVICHQLEVNYINYVNKY